MSTTKPNKNAIAIINALIEEKILKVGEAGNIEATENFYRTLIDTNSPEANSLLNEIRFWRNLFQKNLNQPPQKKGTSIIKNKPETSTFRVLTWNVAGWTENIFVKTISKIDPDVIFLQEAGESWLPLLLTPEERINQVPVTYKYSCYTETFKKNKEGKGLIILSKEEITPPTFDISTVPPLVPDSNDRTFFLTVKIGSILFVNIHLQQREETHSGATRPQTLDNIHKEIMALNLPCLIGGDWNWAHNKISAIEKKYYELCKDPGSTIYPTARSKSQRNNGETFDYFATVGNASTLKIDNCQKIPNFCPEDKKNITHYHVPVFIECISNTN